MVPAQERGDGRGRGIAVAGVLAGGGPTRVGNLGHKRYPLPPILPTADRALPDWAAVPRGLRRPPASPLPWTPHRRCPNLRRQVMPNRLNVLTFFVLAQSAPHVAVAKVGGYPVEGDRQASLDDRVKTGASPCGVVNLPLAKDWMESRCHAVAEPRDAVG